MGISKRSSAATPPSCSDSRVKTLAGRKRYPSAGNNKVIGRINTMAKQLGPGDPFPIYRVPTVSGSTLNIPADIEAEYAVIFFYRGIW